MNWFIDGYIIQSAQRKWILEYGYKKKTFKNAFFYSIFFFHMYCVAQYLCTLNEVHLS